MLGSPVDLAIVGVVVLLVFGPKKVPELGKALGQGIGNFKRALTDATDEVKTGMSEDKPVVEPVKPESGTVVTPTPAQTTLEPAPTAPTIIKDDKVPS